MAKADLQRLDNAIRIVARLIDLSGEDYWPILDRLEQARDELLSRQERMAKYLAPAATPPDNRYSAWKRTRPALSCAQQGSGAP